MCKDLFESPLSILLGIFLEVELPDHIVIIYLTIYLFLATPPGMWNLSSLTGDRTLTSCIGSVERLHCLEPSATLEAATERSWDLTKAAKC